MRSIALSAASSDGRPPSESLRSISSSRRSSSRARRRAPRSCVPAARRRCGRRRRGGPRRARSSSRPSPGRQRSWQPARGCGARSPRRRGQEGPRVPRRRCRRACGQGPPPPGASRRRRRARPDCSGRLRFWALRVCAAPASAALFAPTAASHSSSDMPAWRAAWRAAFRASASRLSSPREGLRFGAALMGAPAAQVGGFVVARLAPMAGFRRGRRMKRLRVA